VQPEAVQCSRVDGKPQVGKVLEDPLEHDSAFQSTERCAEAKVDAVAERDVTPNVGPVNVELCGVVEHCRIAVGAP
jgi:hypothetical protein